MCSFVKDPRSREEYLTGYHRLRVPCARKDGIFGNFASLQFLWKRTELQIASWLGQVPFPSTVDLMATESGMRVRMFTPPGMADGQMKSWASMTHQQTRWVHLGTGSIPKSKERYTLKNTTHVPSISLADRGGDPMLALSGYLLNRRVQ